MSNVQRLGTWKAPLAVEADATREKYLGPVKMPSLTYSLITPCNEGAKLY